MTTIEQLITGTCLTIGCIFLSIPIAVSLDSQPTAKERGAAWGGAIVGIPPTIMGLYLLTDARRRKHLNYKWMEEGVDREIDLTFARLLAQYQGSVTILQLAKVANLTVDEAKMYLEFKALQLNGDFEIVDNGGIIYHFPIV
jgi:hypothetical protein